MFLIAPDSFSVSLFPLAINPAPLLSYIEFLILLFIANSFKESNISSPYPLCIQSQVSLLLPSFHLTSAFCKRFADTSTPAPLFTTDSYAIVL